MILCIGVLLMSIYEKNERLGVINGYTINHLTVWVKDLIENLESEEPNIEEHNILIEKIYVVAEYIRLQNGVSFLNNPTHDYILDEAKFEDFKSKEAMTALKKYYETLSWLYDDLEAYEKKYQDYDENIITYHYLNTHKEEIKAKFYELRDYNREN